MIPGTGIRPMLRLVDIAAFDRVLVDIIPFLTHHLGFNELHHERPEEVARLIEKFLGPESRVT